SKIDELNLIFLGHHDVAGAHVAVEKTSLMEIIQSLGHLQQEVNAVALELSTAGLNEEVKTHAVDQLHYDVLFLLSGQTVLVSGHDILMAQGRANLPFRGTFQADKPG